MTLLELADWHEKRAAGTLRLFEGPGANEPEIREVTERLAAVHRATAAGLKELHWSRYASGCSFSLAKATEAALAEIKP